MKQLLKYALALLLLIGYSQLFLLFALPQSSSLNLHNHSSQFHIHAQDHKILKIDGVYIEEGQETDDERILEQAAFGLISYSFLRVGDHCNLVRNSLDNKAFKLTTLRSPFLILCSIRI